MSNIKPKDSIEFIKMIQRFSRTAKKIYLPGVSIDTVIFSFQSQRLRILLVRYNEISRFGLPGGFIKKNESLDLAARRILNERTGLENVPLEQYYTSGSVDRSQKDVVIEAMKNLKGQLPPGNWFEQRFISVCYYALIDETKVILRNEPIISEAMWIDSNKLPKLLYDHKAIIHKALDRLKLDLDQNLARFNIMNETFTMGELQKLYEAIYQKTFDRTNFQRRMLSMNILERLQKKNTGKAYKSPFLYRFIQ